MWVYFYLFGYFTAFLNPHEGIIEGEIVFSFVKWN